MKRGNTDAILFMKPTYTATGNPFKEAALTLVRKEDRGRQIEVGNDKAFRPAKHVRKDIYKATYEHMKDFEHVKKNYRDEANNNEVITAPRNIQTNPPKLGKIGKNTSFGGQIPYMEDDYNMPKKIALAEREYGYSKMQEKPFSQMAKKKHLFNSHKAVLEENPMIPARAPRPKTPPLPEDQKPFKPSNPGKRGYNKSLAPFPAYIADPIKHVTR